MVNSPYFDLFQKDSVDKQLKIEFDGGAITNEELHNQQFELSESLCSESALRFGACEASSIKFKISNVFTPLKDKRLTVSMVLNGNAMEPFLIGKYKVFSDVPTADRKFRDVVAYDAMYDIINADVSDWYNTVLPNKESTVTLKQFRDSFLTYFDIEQKEVELPNDGMVVERTIDPDKLSGQTVITCICEINGCFGHIGRNGKFQYVFLNEMIEGVYPSDTLYPRDDLYPADHMNVEQISKSHYISAKYEDFTAERINKIQIRKEEDDIGCIYGTGDNCYIVQDNFLVYGKSSEELQAIATNLYSVISRVWYRPSHVEAKGNPCLEIGDGIKLRTKYEIVYTYILQRTLKGIQALRDTYDAEGEQYQSEKVNSVRESIIQLKGKTNKLTRTIDETILEMADMEKNLSAQIAVNAQQILLKVSKDSVISEINQTAEKITISAQKIDLEGLVNADELVSKFATIETLNATSASLQNLIAQKASIDDLNATTATLSSMIAQRATIDQLNGVSARVDNIEANYITASTVKANYMEVANWTSAGHIKAEKIDVNSIASMFNSSNNITVGGLNAQSVVTKSINVSAGASILGKVASWKTITVSGSSYTVLCG